jgi:hypothetical protein
MTEAMNLYSSLVRKPYLKEANLKAGKPVKIEKQMISY